MQKCANKSLIAYMECTCVKRLKTFLLTCSFFLWSTWSIQLHIWVTISDFISLFLAKVTQIVATYSDCKRFLQWNGHRIDWLVGRERNYRSWEWLCSVYWKVKDQKQQKQNIRHSHRTHTHCHTPSRTQLEANSIWATMMTKTLFQTPWHAQYLALSVHEQC